MKTLPLIFLLTIIFCGLSSAQETKDADSSKGEEKLIFKTKWKGERILLPPGFAPDLKLKGIEEIRFAPGMFQPDSDSFFSYVLVFSVADKPELTKDVIHKETLVYYRGLATSVLKSKGKKVDTGKFTLELKKAKEAKDAPKGVKADGISHYVGTLDWIEPFATAKAQKLNFEIQAWSDPKTGKNYLFFCASPKPVGEKDSIWKELREIRSGFAVEALPKK